MQVRFWGTRGSIPKPGPQTVRYGGNTSCVEVRTRERRAAHARLRHRRARRSARRCSPSRTGRARGHMLISHTHWDHIQGLPFFAPLFVPGFEWDIYGPRGLGPSIRETLAGQMQYTYFPITIEQFAAKVRYHDLVEGSFEIDDVRDRRALHEPPGADARLPDRGGRRDRSSTRPTTSRIRPRSRTASGRRRAATSAAMPTSSAAPTC